jgi:hypothetical protein
MDAQLQNAVHTDERGRNIEVTKARTEEDADLKSAEKDRIDFLWKVHSYTNDYIRFADSKAAFVAASSAALIGAVMGTRVLDEVGQKGLAQCPAHCWVGLFALVLLAAAFLSAVFAIRPRLRATTNKGFIFWGSVVEHKNDLSYSKAVQALKTDQLELNVSRHVFALAKICKTKYFWTNLGIVLGTVGGFVACAVMFYVKINLH